MESPLTGKAPPKEHQFKPGQSGNPAGPARGRVSIKAAIERIMAQDIDPTVIPKDLPPGISPRTYADACAVVQVIKALGGDNEMLKFITDHLDGKATQPTTHEQRGPVNIKIDGLPIL